MTKIFEMTGPGPDFGRERKRMVSRHTMSSTLSLKG